MPLYSRCIGEGSPVVLLHGLFGAGNNLGALARHLQQDYTACMLDLPSHGRSAWLERTDLDAMAQAVIEWLESQDKREVHLIGHSLGGKVAMQAALARPEYVRSLVVADIAPAAYPARHQAVFAALRAVAEAQCASRDEAQAVMDQHLEEPDTIAFLLTSLQRDGSGQYNWRFDREGLERDYPALIGEVATATTYTGPTLFIKGAQSDYIQESHWPDITARFPAAQIRVLADTGHWLHAQKPQLFNTTVARFLAAASTPR